jgi:ABC-type polysaccharide/polyol phosphate export permease
MKQLFKEIRGHSQATFMMTRVELRQSVETTRLGWFYWIVDPIIMMMIYYFMVKIVFNRGGENYHLFALCGIASWQFFTRAITKSTTAFSRNAGLIRQVGLPFSIYVIVPTVVQAFFALISYGIIMIWHYPAVGIHTVAIFPLVLLICLLSFGGGLFLSVLEVYFKDTNKLITYLLRAGFFLSPVLYGPERVYNASGIPEMAKWIYGLNPMVWIIPQIRGVLLDGVVFDIREYSILLILSLVLTQCGLLFLRSHRSRIVKSL